MNESIERDAQEFGRHVRQGGWRLGLLVARNVEKAPMGSNLPTAKSRSRSSGKVDATAFAEQANVGIPKGTKAKPNRDRISVDRVLAYLTGWEEAAKDGHVPAANTLSPNEEPNIAWDALPDWSEFYPPVSGGPNGGPGRKSTAKQAKTAVESLPVEEAASLLAEMLDSDEFVAALDEDEEAVEHVFAVATKLAGKRGKSKSKTKSKALQEMTIVLSLIGVLQQFRDLARDDSDSPLVKEFANLMREALEFYERLVEADDPVVVEGLISDFEEWLAKQQ